MKKITQRSLALLLSLLLVVSLLPGICIWADAATVDYQYGSTSSYSNIIINWGKRGELAEFLTSNAESFYSKTTYDYLITLNGSSTLSSVPDSPLYAALNTLMSDAHNKTTSYEQTKNLFQYTDCQENGVNSTKISAFYSGDEVGPAWDSGATWNREHVWPNSKGGSDDSDGGGVNETDIMMLRPETSSNNSSRGNKAFGESSNYFFPNLTGSPYDVRGDVARVVLYTYVRWGTEESEVLNNIWGEAGVMESKEILLKWMKEDPVDTWEMGRNDSVQSITGTRNVFVDYPELAFALFNEDIPEMETPSGNAAALSYTITALSSQNAWGTVSVSGNKIIASPASGYKASGYRVVSGNATVSQNGNIFTVSATSDCTVEITFAAAAMYTVNVVQDNKVITSQQVQENAYFTLPQFSGTLTEGYTFVGWVTAATEPTTQKPAVQDPGKNVAITGDTNFYAVVSYVDGESGATETTWKLVTSTSQIQAGNRVIIAAHEYDVAMSTVQNSNNRGKVDITKSADKSSLTDFPATTAIFTLETGTVSGSFGFKDTSGYIYAVNATSNYLRTQATLNDAASFFITVADGSTSVTSATFESGTSGVGNVPMQYNTQGMFACYPKATQKALALYVEDSVSGTTNYTTAWTETSCSHINTTTTTAAATCTTNGLETVTCNDCGEIVSTTVLTAPGHTAKDTVVNATLTQGGYTQVNCSVCGADLGQKDAVEPLTNIEGWSLTLDSELMVNFKIKVDDSIATTAQIKITFVGVATTYQVSSLTKTDGSYLIPVKVQAPQMTETISVQLTNGSDTTPVKNYSVRQYADILLANQDYSAYHQLVKDMLVYGAAAQQVFGYNTGNLANTDISGAGNQAVPTTEENPMTCSGSIDGAAYYGATLVYREKLAVRFYFTGSVEGVSFTLNGAPCTADYANGMYFVEANGILPQNIEQQITLTATDSQGNTFTATYSPLNYIVRMNQKGSNATKALVTALYNYYLSAKALANK